MHNQYTLSSNIKKILSTKDYAQLEKRPNLNEYFTRLPSTHSLKFIANDIVMTELKTSIMMYNYSTQNLLISTEVKDSALLAYYPSTGSGTTAQFLEAAKTTHKLSSSVYVIKNDKFEVCKMFLFVDGYDVIMMQDDFEVTNYHLNYINNRFYLNMTDQNYNEISVNMSTLDEVKEFVFITSMQTVIPEEIVFMMGLFEEACN